MKHQINVIFISYPAYATFLVPVYIDLCRLIPGNLFFLSNLAYAIFLVPVYRPVGYSLARKRDETSVQFVLSLASSICYISCSNIYACVD